MATLSRDLRRQLERTVVEARTIAEVGAEQSLHRLAVELPRPHDALNDDEKKLRVSLRAHAKQLGDRLDQRPMHLIQAVAYEHWHGLLFARFLIENDLLLHPEHGVALSLDEVKEVALNQNRKWVEVAAEYAQGMLLRRVFQPDDPALRVSLPPEIRLQLEEKLDSLPKELFLADDSLGWVYQYWQRDEKARVNHAETKIGADELSAVTQLFTEDYMVLFLLENTLGAWWTAKRRAEGKDPKLPGYEWTYLRLNEDGTPAAGAFETWPRAVREVRVLDPCMGSGHFLVFALPILTRMRIEEDGLTLKESLAAVLSDNLFGLEIDSRCAQIAAFNLALASWRFAGEHFPLPELNLACSGLGINASENDWVRMAGEDGRAREEMRRLYSLFKDAPTLGSLIDPLRLQANLLTSGAAMVLPLIEEALQREQSDESRELAIAAQGVLAAFRILSASFTLVSTNVPYLGRGKQDSILAKYCAEFHPDAKADLATCFVDRCARFARDGGSLSLVTPQNWLYQVYYGDFLRRILKTESFQWVVRLGPGAFQEITGEVVKAALVVITCEPPTELHQYGSVNASPAKSPADKAEVLRTAVPLKLNQTDFEADESKSLRRVARCYQGISTGDNPRVVAHFWEINDHKDWRFFQVPSEKTVPIGGRTSVVRELVMSDSYKQAALRGREAWGGRGIAIARIGSLAAALYDGDLFANTVPVIVPNDEEHLLAIWHFVNSAEFKKAVVGVNQSLSVDNGYLEKIPFDVDYWAAEASVQYPSGLPKPFTTDPTQWLFDGLPDGADHPLQVAVARLLGYRWPRQKGSSFPGSPALLPDGLEKHADADGIVALSSLTGETSAADRLRVLLSDAFGAEWSAGKLADLLGENESLELWLRDRFFEEHCKIFNHRPFIWHIWDGRKDGFHALVNYHRLNVKTLEKLIYSTLGDWISRQRQDVSTGVEGADSRLAAAEHLQSELKNILRGESPYDVFIRWKSLSGQSTGWNPDLNDGVRLNIRPWITTAKVYRASKPGILRFTPNIKYGKDRGKESDCDVDDFPWLNNSCDRVNDIHLTLDEKRKARRLS
ncbi:MAG TPA: hypothetical protein VGQ49_11345 [Bryobacteraceae bacterium]|jgi:hypothetical protein|nr:hypothetical protein [Bryobacteraceae bacterium]